MGITQVYAGSICGAKQQSTVFMPTGRDKGHYPVYVCDRAPHDRGAHEDSHARKTWR